MLKKAFIFFLVFCFSYSLAYAKQTDAEQELINKLQSIKTLSANFSQVLYDQQGLPLQTSEGTMQLKNRQLFKWHVTSPFDQLILVEKNKVIMFDPLLNQVTISQLSAADSLLPALLLNKDPNKILEQFKVSTSTQNGYTLIPVDKDSVLKLINLIFDGNRLKYMGFKNYLGQTAKISFDHIKINEVISDKVFSFTPPKGADVMNLEKQK